MNKKIHAKSNTLEDKFLTCPRIKLGDLQTLFVDGVATLILPSDFLQQMRRRNADVPDI